MSGSAIESSGIPKLVEPDYDLDTEAPAMEEAEPDPCCKRCGSECSYPGWFSIQEGQKTLDIPASFGPASWQARLIKFCLMVWFNATLIYKWYDNRQYPAFFLAYLTNWSLIFSSLWLIVSFINSMFPPSQPKLPSDSISLWTKFSWLLFTVACPFTLITVLLYWTLDYQPGLSSLGYVNVFTHAGVLLIWPEGLLVDRIPIRWKHLPLPMFLAACYVSWMVIHQLATNIGVPNKFDYVDDDLLYPAVDFEEHTAFSSILATLVVFVATPLMHLLLWSLSLYSFPCNYSGQNRRYLSEYPKDSTESPEESATMTNVNIYEP